MKTLLCLISFALLFPMPQPGKAATAAEINDAVNAKLQNFVAQNPSARELGRKAAGVLVFPSVIKAGFGVGGEYGEGVLIVKGKAAGYYNIISAYQSSSLSLGELPTTRRANLWIS
jgi:lipid-binding SYLF domain-containing protein